MARPTRKQVNIKMPEHLIESLRAKAEAEGDTFTNLVVRFCEQGLGMPSSQNAHQPIDSNLEVIDMRIADLEARLASKVKEQVQLQVQAALGGVQRLRDEAESLRQQLEVAKAPRNLLTPDLEVVRDRILSGLKVGKQSPLYKRTKTAIDQFISELLKL